MVPASALPERFEQSIQTASDWLYYVECLAGGGTIEPIPGPIRPAAPTQRTMSPPRPTPHSPAAAHRASEVLRDHLARWPRPTPHVRYRMAKLLLMQRWQEGGAHYAPVPEGFARDAIIAKVLAALVATAFRYPPLRSFRA